MYLFFEGEHKDKELRPLESSPYKVEEGEDEEETDARLQTSYFEIETMEMTLDNLKHLVIEACAFGGELAVVEDRFDGIEGGVLNQ